MLFLAKNESASAVNGQFASSNMIGALTSHAFLSVITFSNAAGTRISTSKANRASSSIFVPS